MPQGANIAGGALSGASAGFMVGGPWGAVAGAVVGGVLGALEKNPTLQIQKFDPKDVSFGQAAFLQQGEHIGDVSKVLTEANKIDNAAYQADASQFAPNLMGNVKQAGANTSALLGGNLTPGVQNALGKPGATARDLGLTSDQLMQMGASQLGGEVKTATGLNPFNETATDTLISPAALLKRQDQADMQNNQIQNQRLGAVFANAASSDWARQALGMIGSLGGIGGKLGSSISGPGAGAGYQVPDVSYGFGQGDTGPTADSQFNSAGYLTGGWG